MMNEEVIYIDDSDSDVDVEDEYNEDLYIVHGEDLSQDNECDVEECVEREMSASEAENNSIMQNGLSSMKEEQIHHGTVPEVKVIVNRGVFCCSDNTNMAYESQRVEYFENPSRYPPEPSCIECVPALNSGFQYTSGYYGNPNLVNQNLDFGYNFSTPGSNQAPSYCRECDYGSVPIFSTTDIEESPYEYYNFPASHPYSRVEQGEPDMATNSHKGCFDNWGGDFEAEYRFWEDYFGKARSCESSVNQNQKNPIGRQNTDEIAQKDVRGKKYLTPNAENKDKPIEDPNLLRVKIFRCDACKYYSVKKDDLVKHVKNKHLPPNFTRCSYCNRKVLKKNLERHIRKAHSKQDYKCTICLKKFSRLHSAWKHCYEHFEDWTPNRLRCAFCAQELDSRMGLKDHLVFKHLLEGTTQCLRCAYQADDLQKLKYHLKACHAIS